MNLTPKDISRFRTFYLQRSEDRCWKWEGSKHKKGYGQFVLNSSQTKAHRVAYQIANGPFDYILQVLHNCDNPSCVNPQHLFLGTAQDNTNDMLTKNRQYHPVFFSDEVIKSIRELYATGNYYQRQLATQFGMSQTHISMIIGRLTRR